jgi:hypothetical protein
MAEHASITLRVPVRWQLPAFYDTAEPTDVGMALTLGASNFGVTATTFAEGRAATLLAKHIQDKESEWARQQQALQTALDEAYASLASHQDRMAAVADKTRREVDAMWETRHKALLERSTALQQEINATVDRETDRVKRQKDEEIQMLKELNGSLMRQYKNAQGQAQTQVDDAVRGIRETLEQRAKVAEDRCDKLEKEIISQLQTMNTQRNTVRNNSSLLGSEGERLVEAMLHNAFRMMAGFRMETTGKTKHSGDFHLHFAPDDLHVLVDSKNYQDRVASRNSVGRAEVDKIIRDVDADPGMNAALLISMYTRVDGFGQCDLTYTFTPNDKPVIIMNRIDPAETEKVRDDLYKAYMMIRLVQERGKKSAEQVLEEARRKGVLDIAQKEQRLARELRTAIEKVRDLNQQQLDQIDKQIAILLGQAIDAVSAARRFSEWFSDHYERAAGEAAAMTFKSVLDAYHAATGRNILQKEAVEYLSDVLADTDMTAKPYYRIHNWQLKNLNPVAQVKPADSR